MLTVDPHEVDKSDNVKFYMMSCSTKCSVLDKIKTFDGINAHDERLSHLSEGNIVSLNQINSVSHPCGFTLSVIDEQDEEELINDEETARIPSHAKHVKLHKKVHTSITKGRP